MASFDVVETHLLAFGSFANYLALGLTVDRDKVNFPFVNEVFKSYLVR